MTKKQYEFLINLKIKKEEFKIFNHEYNQDLELYASEKGISLDTNIICNILSKIGISKNNISLFKKNNISLNSFFKNNFEASSEIIKNTIKNIAKNEIQTIKINIFELFNSKNIFLIKEYQRRYDWKSSQVEMLLNELKNSNENEFF